MNFRSSKTAVNFAGALMTAAVGRYFANTTPVCLGWTGLASDGTSASARREGSSMECP